MRSRHKEWQNKRHGWTRRVIWYAGDNDVRLKFEDTGKAVANKVYNLPHQLEEANADWDRFKKGEPVEVWLDGHKTTI